MAIQVPIQTTDGVTYPESDGRPIAENTKQFRWIVTIVGGLEAHYLNNPDVFVAGDLLWYPVEGHSEIWVAPDALVAFGRPKGDRGAYIQYREEGVPPQVVFEVLSPTNTVLEMLRKLRFYERYGVEEYYAYDPDRGDLSGWVRHDNKPAALDEIPQMRGWISPRLGIRFDLEGTDLRLRYPDGTPFASYTDLIAQREHERQRAEHEHRRADRLAAQLRALGVEPGEK